MRTRTLWLWSAPLTALMVVLGVQAGTRHAAVVDSRSSGFTSPTTRALAVLRHWDRRRARAWADDDARGLRSLYVHGSSAGRRDLAMLAAYDGRGFRVRSMRRQVLEVRVRRSLPRQLTMLVTDRLVDATVARAGVRTALPESRPTTRRIELRRIGGSWRVVEVYAPRPSPVASTAVTSRSRNS